MKQPSIDVIIPVYNGQAFIKDAIASAVQQTYLPRQITVVDDGSTDATEQVVYKYKTQIASPILIKYIKKNNGGLSSARNKGIESCTSEFIALLDADDIWEKDKLEKQINVFRFNHYKNLGVVYCNYSEIDIKGELLHNTSSFFLDTGVRGNIFEHLLYGNKIASSGSGVLVRKECFDKVGIFDESLPASEDWDMWLRIAEFYDFDYVNEKLVKLRRHGENMSNNKRRLLIGDVLVLNKYIKSRNINYITIRKLRYEIIKQILKEFPSRTFYNEINMHLSKGLKTALFRDFLGVFSDLIVDMATSALTCFKKVIKFNKFYNIKTFFKKKYRFG